LPIPSESNKFSNKAVADRPIMGVRHDEHGGSSQLG
jgi:hypothetical protein